MEFSNANARVNRSHITKVASAYDALATSNRPVQAQLQVSSLSARDNDKLRNHISKMAGEVGGNELAKRASGLDKHAFLSGGLDLFTRTKGLITNKLGVPEAAAHDLASPVVTQALKIQGAYGGDEGHIVERLVDEMQNHLSETVPTAAHHTLGAVQENMAVTSTKSLEDQVKQRLMAEAGLNAYEADRFKKTVVAAARDLVTILRPHKMNEIADAIITLMIEHHDPTVAYSVTERTHLDELRQLLGETPQ